MQKKKVQFVFWLYCLFVLLTFVVAVILQNINPTIKSLDKDDSSTFTFVRGKIVKIGAEGENGDIPLSVFVEDGDQKGMTLPAPQNSLNTYNKYKIGDHVLVSIHTDMENGKHIYETVDYYHQSGIFWIFVIFTVFAVIFAKIKGATAIASVLISLGLFVTIFLRMIVIGFPPLGACIVFTGIVTILTIPLIHGFNKKSLSSILAIFAGYTMSILIAFLFRNLVSLGNTPAEDFRGLSIMFPDINMSDILITSLFLGAVGALIDTSISISSAIFEALKEQSKLEISKVYRIGMEVGKDVLASMINTLLFAYLAGALPFLLAMFLTGGSSFTELINSDFIALELTRTLVGALSLVVVIPITAIISAYFLAKTEFKFKNKI